MSAPKFDSFNEFFPYYLAEHANPTCRRLHYIGTVLATSIFVYALISNQWAYMLLFPIVGYGFAWFAHFKFERNRPATFDYPLWSFLGDYKMLWLALLQRLDDPLRAGIKKYGKHVH